MVGSSYFNHEWVYDYEGKITLKVFRRITVNGSFKLQKQYDVNKI